MNFYHSAEIISAGCYRHTRRDAHHAAIYGRSFASLIEQLWPGTLPRDSRDRSRLQRWLRGEQGIPGIASATTLTVWRRAEVVTAPLVLTLPRQLAGGTFDALLLTDVFTVVSFVSAPPSPAVIRSATAELGAAVAALADHHVLEVGCCVAILAPPGEQARAVTIHPQDCLTAWCEAWDCVRALHKPTPAPCHVA